MDSLQQSNSLIRNGMSMDALKLHRSAMIFTAAGLLFFCHRSLDGAETYETVNFFVTAERAETAEEVGKAAEVYRRQLAVFWLGKPLPNWSRPCRLTVREGAMGAGGQTTFQFSRGEVLNWRMDVYGTKERILDSVLPHEVNHTIFACHFRRPLPRWADEGAATLFEHRSEQLKQLALLNQVVRNPREMISLRDLLSMKDYPKGQRPMLILYAQGYALADFLVQQKGRHAYLTFISDGERNGWEQAIKSNFDHDGIESLEKNWRGWILAGMPKLTLPREQMLAGVEAQVTEDQMATRPEMPISRKLLPSIRRSRAQPVVRSQSPDPINSVRLETARPDNARPENAGPDNARFENSPFENPRPATTRASRIEAPVPRRSLMSSQLPDQAGMPGRRAGLESEGTGDEGNQNNGTRSDDTRRSEFISLNSSITSAVKTAAGSNELQPTSIEEEDKRASRTAEFEFGAPVRKLTPQPTTGSKPGWAGFPGDKF